MLNIILLSRCHLTLRLRGLRVGPQYIYGPTIAGIPVCRVRGVSGRGSVGKMSSKGASASSQEEVVRHPQSRAALKSFSERIERPSTLWTIFSMLLGVAVCTEIACVRTDHATVMYELWCRSYLLHGPDDLRKLTNKLLRDICLRQRLLAFSNIKGVVEKWKHLPVLWRKVTVQGLIVYLKGLRSFMTEDATRVCWTICATNCFFWLLWKTPLRPFMHHAFTHNPLDGRFYTTVTSMFSHRSIVHLVVSCSALTCFGTPIAAWMTQHQDDRVNPSTYESTSEYHLLAFIFFSSIVSVSISQIAFLTLGWRRMMSGRALSQLHASIPSNALHSPLPLRLWLRISRYLTPAPKGHVKDMPQLVSIGASGPTYALATLSVLAAPDAQLMFSNMPMPSIGLQQGLSAALLFDFLGVFYGWRRFDHWAHIGGAAFGAVYYVYGVPWWNYWMKHVWNAYYKEPFERWLIFAQKEYEKDVASGAFKAPPSINLE